MSAVYVARRGRHGERAAADQGADIARRVDGGVRRGRGRVPGCGRQRRARRPLPPRAHHRRAQTHQARHLTITTLKYRYTNNMYPHVIMT